MNRRADDPRIPWTSTVFGYGPMLPLVAGALGCWLAGGETALLAVRLSIIWAALILAFIGGVRRGFGFGQDRASTPAEIVAATLYLGLAALALIVPRADVALALLAAGYAAAALLDWRAARRGNAPAHFARLRPPQLMLGCLALAAEWLWLLR